MSEAVKDPDIAAMVELRKELEEQIKQARTEQAKVTRHRESLEGDLHRLQRKCPHSNVEKGRSWQGGGLYFIHCHCLDCNKSGDRYDRALTIQENRKWDTLWKRDKGEEYYEEHTPQKAGLSFGGYDW